MGMIFSQRVMKEGPSDERRGVFYNGKNVINAICSTNEAYMDTKPSAHFMVTVETSSLGNHELFVTFHRKSVKKKPLTGLKTSSLVSSLIDYSFTFS